MAVLFAFTNLVMHVGYYTIVTAGILVFLNKKQVDLPIAKDTSINTIDW